MSSAAPEIDRAAPLRFIVNAASGSNDADSKRTAIEGELNAAGRKGELLFARHGSELKDLAREAAQQAVAQRGAVVAVGGDGTLNTVAQAAHAAGCAMGAVAQGTFNYFARTHRLPLDAAEAVRVVLDGTPTPVQVAAVNDHLFLVNASLGLYPELLEDRERYKARFGRNRLVATWAAFVTLARAQSRLRLHIELGDTGRDVRTLTLFVGNNRLQLEQVGIEPPSERPGRKPGHVTAVMLKPIGTAGLIRLMVRGALGTLGEADSVESFEFTQMRVDPWSPYMRRTVKVACDGEVTWMRAPLAFRVLPRPLFLLKPAA